MGECLSFHQEGQAGEDCTTTFECRLPGVGYDIPVTTVTDRSTLLRRRGGGGIERVGFLNFFRENFPAESEIFFRAVPVFFGIFFNITPYLVGIFNRII